eukprot:gene19833-21775_t
MRFLFKLFGGTIVVSFNDTGHFHQWEIDKDASGAKKIGYAATAPPGPADDGKTGEKTPVDKPKKAAKEQPDYLRIVPASILVLIFVGGSVSIFVWERHKERLKKREELEEIADAQLNNEWIENLRNRRRRKSVFQRVRTMSWSTNRSQQESGSETDRIDPEKAKKYKIYDDMLATYWETLDVLRKGARSANKEDGSKPTAARLKELAQLHQAKSSEGKNEQLSVMEQYELMLKEAEEKAKMKKQETSSDDDDESTTDPSKLHKRRRSSRFRKQANFSDNDNEVAADHISQLHDATSLSQSYLASCANIPSHDDLTSATDQGEEERISDILDHITPREVSALHRLQMKMRPKSLIENLAAIHRENVATASSIAALPTSSLHEIPMRGESSKKSLPLLGLGRKRFKENMPEASVPPGTSTNSSVTVSGRQRIKCRPQSLYETGATKRKVSMKRFRSRPSSLYMPHTIQEDVKPTVKVIDIDSLQNLEDYALSPQDEDHVMAKLEEQLIADVCDDSELSKEEIEALEHLLEMSCPIREKDNLTEPKRKLTKQYSLLKVEPSTTQEGRPDLTTQLSFTDSVSLFDGINEDDREEERDKSEETVLLSLADNFTKYSGK